MASSNGGSLLEQELQREKSLGDKLRQILRPEQGDINDIATELKEERIRSQLLRCRLENQRLRQEVFTALEAVKKENESLSKQMIF